MSLTRVGSPPPPSPTEPIIDGVVVCKCRASFETAIISRKLIVPRNWATCEVDLLHIVFFTFNYRYLSVNVLIKDVDHGYTFSPVKNCLWSLDHNFLKQNFGHVTAVFVWSNFSLRRVLLTAINVVYTDTLWLTINNLTVPKGHLSLFLETTFENHPNYVNGKAEEILTVEVKELHQKKTPLEKKSIRKNSIRKHSIRMNSTRKNYIRNNFIRMNSIRAPTRFLSITDLVFRIIHSHWDSVYTKDAFRRMNWRSIESSIEMTILIWNSSHCRSHESHTTTH